jgi:hypothetical protein
MQITFMRFETGSFEFTAFGADRSQAFVALGEAWARHCEQTGADPDMLSEYRDSIEEQTVSLGAAYRDGQLLSQLQAI